MKNYERYLKKTAEEYEKEYEKKTIMYYLCRISSDRIIIPSISEIKGKHILDVGLGAGCYTKILIENNEVTGVDRNPHLCRLPIKVYGGDATQLAELVGAERFDIVFSTWMTEYLSPEQLSGFFRQAKMVLNDNGELMSTIISKYGFGFLYVTAAKLLRGISKYNYGRRQVCDKLREASFTEISIVNLSSWLHVPWAYLVIAR